MTTTRVPRRRLDTEARRAEIVAAALRTFATRDVAGVSVEELAKEAGASAGLVYHYFGGRDGLAAAALGTAADELLASLDGAGEGPAIVQLDATLHAYLDYLAGHPVSWGALLRADAAGVEPGASIARRVDDHAVVLACRALGAGDPPAMLLVALRGWLDLVKGTCLRWLESDAPGREEVHGFLASAFVGSLQAAAGVDPACQAALDALT